MLMWLSKQLCFYKYIWIWMDMDGYVHGKKDNVKNRLDCLSVTDKVHHLETRRSLGLAESCLCNMAA